MAEFVRKELGTECLKNLCKSFMRIALSMIVGAHEHGHGTATSVSLERKCSLSSTEIVVAGHFAIESPSGVFEDCSSAHTCERRQLRLQLATSFVTHK